MSNLIAWKLTEEEQESTGRNWWVLALIVFLAILALNLYVPGMP